MLATSLEGPKNREAHGAVIMTSSTTGHCSFSLPKLPETIAPLSTERISGNAAPVDDCPAICEDREEEEEEAKFGPVFSGGRAAELGSSTRLDGGSPDNTNAALVDCSCPCVEGGVAEWFIDVLVTIGVCAAATTSSLCVECPVIWCGSAASSFAFSFCCSSHSVLSSTPSRAPLTVTPPVWPITHCSELCCRIITAFTMERR